MKRKIILATTSPRRHELAKAMGLDFTIKPSKYEEDMTLDIKPEKLVKLFALGKAEDVAKRQKRGIVIGVDTVVVMNNKAIGKPKNKKEAYKTLRSLSNKNHYVYSGVSLIDCRNNKIVNKHEKTKVHFRKLTDKEINSYIETGQPMDKAGAYGMQDLASIFVDKVEGCYFNILGFPINVIYKNLKKLGVDIFKYERWKPVK